MYLLRILFLILILTATSAVAAANQVDNIEIKIKPENLEKTLADFSNFAHFPAEEKTTKAADVEWESHTQALTFRSSLRKAFKEGPNFNGHYSVALVGCGSPCQIYWIIDNSTGKIVTTFTTRNGANFNLNSSLIVADAMQAEDFLSGAFGRRMLFQTYVINNGAVSKTQNVDLWVELPTVLSDEVE